MNPIPPPLSELNLADSRLDRSQLEALMIEYYDILELIILSNSRGVSQSHSILWSCLCPDDHWVVDNLGCVRYVGMYVRGVMYVHTDDGFM